MYKAKELIGKDIVHQATGERLASVQDLLLDPDARHIVALLVDGGWFNNARIVRWSSVVSSSDVVIVQGDNPIGIASNDPEVADLLKQDIRMTGKTIISDGGERIGSVGDLFINDAGEVVGYEVKQGFINDLSGRKFLPVGKVRAVGKDAIIADTADLKPTDQTEQEPNDQQTSQL